MPPARDARGESLASRVRDRRTGALRCSQALRQQSGAHFLIALGSRAAGSKRSLREGASRNVLLCALWKALRLTV